MANEIETFARFKDLPIELRYKIYHYALTPRLVYFPRAKRRRTRLQKREVDDIGPPFTYNISTLLINKESNRELSPLYRHHLRYERRAGQATKIYQDFRSLAFNPKVDTLFFGDDHASTLIEDGLQLQDLEKIRYIGTFKSEPADDTYNETFLLSLFKILIVFFDNCPALERLYLFSIPDRQGELNDEVVIKIKIKMATEHARHQLTNLVRQMVDDGELGPLDMPQLERDGLLVFIGEERLAKLKKERDRWLSTFKVVSFDKMTRERGILDGWTAVPPRQVP